MATFKMMIDFQLLKILDQRKLGFEQFFYQNKDK